MLALGGCGSDTSSGGEPDTGTDVAGLERGPRTSAITFYLHALDAQGECCADPLTDGIVVVENQSERREIATGAGGRFDLDIGPDDVVDITIFHEGYQIYSWLDATYDAVASWSDGDQRWGLISLSGDPIERVRFNAVATGVPEGGTYCVSLSAGLAFCRPAGQTLTLLVLPRDEPIRISALSWDGDRLVDVEALELQPFSADTEVAIAFDSQVDQPIESVTFRLDLPADPDSPLRSDVNIAQLGPALVVEPGTHLVIGGTASMTRSSDGDGLNVTVRYVPPTEGEPVFRVDVAIPELSARSQRYFYEGPVDGAHYSLLDVPVPISPTEGGDLRDPVAWRTIEGVDLYRAAIVPADTGRPIWYIRVDDAQGSSHRLPAFPEGYDRSVDWPPDGAMGSIWVEAWKTLPMAVDETDDSWRWDFQVASGWGPGITLSGP